MAPVYIRTLRGKHTSWRRLRGALAAWCALLAATSVEADVRLFLAPPGAETDAATTGPTTVLLMPGEAVRLALWVEDTGGEQTLNAFQVALPVLAKPLGGAEGQLSYVNADGKGPGDTVHVDGAHPAWVFAQLPQAATPGYKEGTDGIFGVTYMTNFGTEVNLTTPGEVPNPGGVHYLMEFEISASPDACGQFVIDGSATFPRSALFTASGAEFFVDEFQPVVVTVGDPSAPEILHVDVDAPPGGDGSSWPSALSSLQDALAVAPCASAREIWVAEGIYHPDTGGQVEIDDRQAAFHIPSGLRLYGGFGGTETALGQRNHEAHPTILSGDLAGNDGSGFANRSENSVHVVVIADTEETILDGFVISGGNADGVDLDAGGGGILVTGGSAVIRNSTLLDNAAVRGGAVFANTTTVTLRNTRMLGNRSGSEGGAGVLQNCTAALVNCVVASNSTIIGRGGGVFVTDNSSSQFANCTIANNLSGGDGGGIAIDDSAVVIANTILWANLDNGGSNIGDNAQLDAVDAEPIVDFTIISGGWDGPGGDNIIELDPQFIDSNGLDGVSGTIDDDYSVLSSSPAIDAGSNVAVTPSTPLDAAGATRFVDVPLTPDSGFGFAPLVDIGAYEAAPDCNDNGVPDAADITTGAADCNHNGIIDDCEIDTDRDLIPDDCDNCPTTANVAQSDIDGDAVGDVCDNCPQLANGGQTDVDGDDAGDACDNCPLIPNSAQADCDNDNRGDACAIASGTAIDCDGNGVPDLCDLAQGAPDCNDNSIPDQCEIDSMGGAPGGPFFCTSGCDPDCNASGIPDICETNGELNDCNANGIPDDCEADCNANGIADECDITAGATDCNLDGTPDVCEIDINSSAAGGPFFCTTGCSADCNDNGVPDDCDISISDCPNDRARCDCDGDGSLDSCAIALNGSLDVDADGLLDSCSEFVGSSPGPGGPDLWSTPTNWFPTGVPNNGPGTSHHASLPGADNDVLLDMSVAIDALVVGSGAQLAIDDTGDLTLATPNGLTNEGDIVVGEDRAIIADTSLALRGSSTVRLAHPSARLSATLAPNVMTNLTTIAGSGIIEAGLVNNGEVRADVSNELLVIEGPQNTHNGLYCATNDGTLELATAINGSGSFLASNGTITLIAEPAHHTVSGSACTVTMHGSVQIGDGVSFTLSDDMTVSSGGALLLTSASALDLAGTFAVTSGGRIAGSNMSSAAITAEQLYVTGGSFEPTTISLSDTMTATITGAVILGDPTSPCLGCSPPVIDVENSAQFAARDVIISNYSLARLSDSAHLDVDNLLNVTAGGQLTTAVTSSVHITSSEAVISSDSQGAGTVALNGTTELNVLGSVVVFSGPCELSGCSPPVIDARNAATLTSNALILSGTSRINMFQSAAVDIGGPIIMTDGAQYSAVQGASSVLHADSLTINNGAHVDLTSGQVDLTSLDVTGPINIVNSGRLSMKGVARGTAGGGIFVFNGGRLLAEQILGASLTTDTLMVAGPGSRIDLDQVAVINAFGTEVGGDPPCGAGLGCSPPVIEARSASALNTTHLRIFSLGSVELLDSAVLDVSGIMRIESAGTLRGSSTARAHVGELELSEGAPALELMGQMQLTIAGTLTAKANACPIQVPTCEAPTLQIIENTDLQIGGDLRLYGNPHVTVESDVSLANDLVNHGTDAERFDWKIGTLFCNGMNQELEAASEDRGPEINGYDTNYSIGTIELDSATVVYVVDHFDNQLDGDTDGDEALYVDTLVLNPGSKVVTGDIHIYYRTLINNGGDVPGLGSTVLKVGGSACTDVQDCSDADGDDIRDSNCLWWACKAGECLDTSIVFADMGGQFGECVPDGTADGNDRFHALNCFSDTGPDGRGSYLCEEAAPTAFNVDAGGQFGSCLPDGVCDGNDAFHALNAFAGTTTCTCPPGGDPNPLVGKQELSASLVLHASTVTVTPGGLIHVDVLLDSPLEDLRGYQLHLASSGGTAGHLQLIDITISGPGHVFATAHHWSAFNRVTSQMVAGLDTPGIAAKAHAYLATFTYRASLDATGTFAIDILRDPANAEERTFLFPTPAHSRIVIEPAAPLRVKVSSAPRSRR